MGRVNKFAAPKTSFSCDLCDAKFAKQYNLARHKTRKHSNQSLLYSCGICKLAFATVASLDAHRDEQHRHNHQFQVMESAHGFNCARLRLVLPFDFATADEGLFFAHPKTVQLIETLLTEKPYFKVCGVLAVEMSQLKDGVEVDVNVFHFNGGGFFPVSRDRSFRRDLANRFANMAEAVEEFLHRGSGWCVKRPLFLDATLVVCKPMAGGCNAHQIYKPRGGDQISVKELGGEDDGMCFYKAVAKKVLLESLGNDVVVSDAQLEEFVRQRMTLLPPHRRQYVRVDDIDEFEWLNSRLNVAVHVVSKDEKGNIVPVRCSRITKPSDRGRIDVPLLLCKFAPAAEVSDESATDSFDLGWHYTLIENPMVAFGRRFKRPDGSIKSCNSAYICWNCASVLTRQAAFDRHVGFCHQNECRVVNLPDDGETRSFAGKRKAKKRVFNSAYMLIFDFEALQVVPDKSCSCPDCYLKPDTVEEAQAQEAELWSDRAMQDAEDYKKWEEERVASGRSRFRKFKPRRHHLPKYCPHKTRVLAEQPPFCFSYVVIDREGKLLEHSTYTGDDAAEVFVRRVLQVSYKYLPQLSPGEPMDPMTAAEREELVDGVDTCWICEKTMEVGDRAVDHDHISGEVLGVAHIACNLNRKEVPQLTCVAHNFSGYDSHFLVKALDSCPEIVNITGIPTTMQKFKTLTVNHNIKFIDSLQFLQGSLSSLVDVLSSQKHSWPILSQLVPDPDLRNLLTAKAPFPYSFCTSVLDLFACDHLPDKVFFNNQLTGEECTDEDYARAQQLWDAFGCQHMQNFTTLYVNMDVVLLAEVFLNYKNDIYKAFGLDACQYLSTPHVAMDAMLKMTGVSLEMISDAEMVDMVASSIRGGLSYAGLRYAKTSEPEPQADGGGGGGGGIEGGGVEGDSYLGGEGSSLMFVDKNNLYGEAMMQPLPVKDYRWLEPSQLSELEAADIERWVSRDAATGYIFEVTLSYPSSLHLKHNAYPLAPHTMQIEAGHLSQYQKDCLNILKPGAPASAARARKLTASFMQREKYVVHGRTLAFYIRHGLVLEEVHRAIVFTQAPFVRPFIESCARMRKEALTKTEQEMFKLFANSCYGKFIENTANRMDIRFNRTAQQAKQHASSPLFRGNMICGENLTVSFLNKPEVDMRQVWAVGFTVLELSKLHMQELYYDILQPRLGWACLDVVMSDTDSFLLSIRGHTVPQVRVKLADIMDFSNLDKNHELYDESRKKVPGYLKDEMPNTLIEEVVALKPKTYAVVASLAGVTTVKKAAKGVKQSVKEHIAFGKFKDCLSKVTRHSVVQRTLQSKDHVNRLMEQEKVAFDSYDSKRFALCAVHTCPYGSWLIGNYWDHVEDETQRCFYCVFDLLNSVKLIAGHGTVYLPHLNDPRPDWDADREVLLLADSDMGVERSVPLLREVRRRLGLLDETEGRDGWKCKWTGLDSLLGRVREILASLGVAEGVMPQMYHVEV